MRNMSGTKWFLRTTLLGLLSLLFFTSLSIGAEQRFFVPSYEGEELARVREWEKTWVGKRVDKTNVDQVKDFLLEKQVSILKDPEYMAAKEFWFEIIPYREIPLTKIREEMTRKFAPGAKLEGDELVNFENMAGVIFPEPKTGIEIAYNYDFQSRGDSRYYFTTGSVVDPRTRLKRNASMDRWAMYWTGRSYTEPYPKLPNNPKNFRKTYFNRHFEPADQKDMTILEVKYNDPKQEDERWVYMPNFRRLSRTSQTQRGDNTGSTEAVTDDADGGWGDHMDRNTYKLLGRKELLVPRHQDPTKLIWPDGTGILNGAQRERVKTFEVEVKYKQSHYVYSKQIWYIDPELWLIIPKICWDEDGKLWRYQEVFYGPVKTVNGEVAYTQQGVMMWDVYGRHASLDQTSVTKDVGKVFPAMKFTLGAMQKTAY